MRGAERRDAGRPAGAHLLLAGACLQRIGRKLSGSETLAQVREVRGQEVVCVAQNDAMLGGLLTVIHSELNESGMSSLQARRPCRSMGVGYALGQSITATDWAAAAVTRDCMHQCISLGYWV